MKGWLAWAAAGVVVAACASGCGGGQDPPPTACSDGARTVLGALQLGFLVGAVRRGANKTNGVQLELVRRLDQVAGVGGPTGPRRAAYRRGMAAGEDHG